MAQNYLPPYNPDIELGSTTRSNPFNSPGLSDAALDENEVSKELVTIICLQNCTPHDIAEGGRIDSTKILTRLGASESVIKLAGTYILKQDDPLSNALAAARLTSHNGSPSLSNHGSSHKLSQKPKPTRPSCLELSLRALVALLFSAWNGWAIMWLFYHWFHRSCGNVAGVVLANLVEALTYALGLLLGLGICVPRKALSQSQYAAVLMGLALPSLAGGILMSMTV